MVLTRSAAKKALLVHKSHRSEKQIPTDKADAKNISRTHRYPVIQSNEHQPRAQENELATGDLPKRTPYAGFSCFTQRLNLDVILLMTSNMHPADLLSFAYTCKSIRCLLMDKSASFAWRAARLDVDGLPDCPIDLTEQQYARLLFNNKCQGCENRTGKLYWKVHRRYCSDCRARLFRPLASCESPIRDGGILPTEKLAIGPGRYYLSLQEGGREWVDGEQVEALLGRLRTSSDVVQLLDDMRERHRCITQNADKCMAWERSVVEQRTKSVIEHLQDLGYENGIMCEGSRDLKSFHESVFTSLRPFTETEWARMCPRWLEIMQDVRKLKQNRSLFQMRSWLLTSEYDKWIQCPASSAAMSDILPHVADVAGFHPFDAIIKSPEEIKLTDKMFSSALMELPALTRDWRSYVDAEIAALCAVSRGQMAPEDADATDGQPMHNSESLTADRYNLASIMFRPSTPHRTLCQYPELLFLSIFQSHRLPATLDTHPSFTWSTLRADGSPAVRMCREASYVVRACGLDTAVATIDDMEHRNARLICLMCDGSRLVRSWINAICHAELNHQSVPYNPTLPRWRLLSDDCVDLIESVESQGGLEPPKEHYFRCLLCRPRVGDVWSRRDILQHIASSHGMKKSAAKRSVHYAPLKCIDISSNAVSVVEMVEDEECVTFRVTGT